MTRFVNLPKSRRACGVEIDRQKTACQSWILLSIVRFSKTNRGILSSGIQQNWDTASDVPIVDYDKPNFDDWDKSSGKEQPDGTEHAVSGDAVKKMEIDCPDDVRASHHVVAGSSPRLCPNLEQRNVTLSASPNDSAHTLEVPDLPCSVQ